MLSRSAGATGGGAVEAKWQATIALVVTTPQTPAALTGIWVHAGWELTAHNLHPAYTGKKSHPKTKTGFVFLRGFPLATDDWTGLLEQ